MNPKVPWYWIVIVFLLMPAFATAAAPLPVDRNMVASGNYLAQDAAEGFFETVPIAGYEGGEDIIWCRFTRAGSVGDIPVTIWACRDGNSKWNLGIGNDGRWWIVE